MNVKTKWRCYKTCAVPFCKSTTISTPHKLFIHVPKNPNIRRNWLILAGRLPTALLSSVYFCEDHFNLEDDMENYIEYTTMGAVSSVKMRPGCLPTKFACQQEIILTDNIPNSKRKKFSFTAESEQMRMAALIKIENVNKKRKRLKSNNETEDALFEQKIEKIDKSVQVKFTVKCSTKSTQTEN
ncbi:PREDICTED: uncharacterized protein LOC106105239 [Papilio polytes]|uniref:uncharacterized protein LOC106105239 n=1 Tax=Papilio polytes TaxID=76194 RepID=UPI000676528A|nr:PREDICTED: uncharacterized protein LOC106105239 [Papilio polytes]